MRQRVREPSRRRHRYADDVRIAPGEALSADPGEACPPLAGDVEADVLVVGGGYTGMWSAYFLTERQPDARVVLLERGICGGGPSGRNGGFLNALWEDIEVLVRSFGEARALETCLLAERSVTEIGTWCERNGVDAWYRRDGHLGVATSPS